MRRLKGCVLGILSAFRLWADNNPGPSQPANAVNPPYAAATLNEPFPDATYGADHGGSSIALTYPFVSPFGQIDHSRGVSSRGLPASLALCC